MKRRTFIQSSLGMGTMLGMPLTSLLKAAEEANRIPEADRLNVAYIGVGGHGAQAVRSNQMERTAAFCDVDDRSAEETYSLFPEVPRFRDFRVMFDKLGKGIDAVSICTPDHTHFPIAMEAMRRGYPIYLEKPMAHTISQIRTLRAAAAKYKVTTQLGIQGHSHNALRLLKEWLDAGVIGPVSNVHLWTDRPMDRDYHGFEADAPAEPVPDGLDWDLWLGPARHRPYNPVYLPMSWRGWWDFGNGPLGDIGAHMWDVLEFCLNLGAPAKVTAVNPRMSQVGTPRWCTVDYSYPARQGRGPVTVHWQSGLKDGQPHMPADLPFLPEGKELHKGAAIYLVGKEGAIYISAMRVQAIPEVFPRERWLDFKAALPPRTLPRLRGSHHEDFFNAIREGRKAGAGFDYGAPLNEGVLVGNLALLTGKTIHWDSENMKATGVPEADPFIHAPEPRDGWKYAL